jgi:hypothetical protein
VGKWDKVVIPSIMMAILAVAFDPPSLWTSTGVSVAVAVLYGGLAEGLAPCRFASRDKLNQG